MPRSAILPWEQTLSEVKSDITCSAPALSSPCLQGCCLSWTVGCCTGDQGGVICPCSQQGTALLWHVGTLSLRGAGTKQECRQVFGVKVAHCSLDLELSFPLNTFRLSDCMRAVQAGTEPEDQGQWLPSPLLSLKEDYQEGRTTVLSAVYSRGNCKKLQ